MMASQPVLTDWNSDLFECCESASTCKSFGSEVVRRVSRWYLRFCFCSGCYGFWCCPCLACTVAGKYGENRCLPLCDIISPAVCVICEIPCFAPPAALSLRANMRSKYGIKVRWLKPEAICEKYRFIPNFQIYPVPFSQGSLCKDIVASCFCAWCSWCQMHRELKYRSKNPTVINVFNQTIVSQPPPVVIMNPKAAPPYASHY